MFAQREHRSVMLHIVPALLILLLQGPGGLEKMAHAGKCPEAVALLRSMGIQHTEHRQSANQGSLSNASPAVALSAIRASKQDFGKLLEAIASLYAELESASPSVQPDTDTACLAPPPQPSAVGTVHDGFIANSRTRDGPR
ncbi:MAG: hypothetical protein KF784_13150 [Fimbriimonadaceae bacterium]|nr:hypothetical protein [Fimbriimonadaceae bacterium]